MRHQKGWDISKKRDINNSEVTVQPPSPQSSPTLGREQGNQRVVLPKLAQAVGDLNG